MNALNFVIGYDDIKTELYRIRDVLLHLEKYERFGVIMPTGMLFYGEAGMGKSLMASCFIAELDCPVFQLHKEQSGYDAADEIRQAFAQAKETKGLAVVFLDNLDETGAEVYGVLRACMDEAVGSSILVIATAKDKDDLPDFLLHAGRIDKVYELETPEPPQIEKMIRVLLPAKKFTEEVDVAEIALILAGSSCAEVKDVVSEAGVYVVTEGRKRITQQDLLRACLRRRIFKEQESVVESDAVKLRRNAVHEAGHAVTAELQEPGSVCLVSVGSYAGGHYGVTSVRTAEGCGETKQLMEKHIRGLLAGKAATEIVLGLADTGCADDLRKAFQAVATMVDDFCIFGFDSFDHPEASEALRGKRDCRITMLMEKYYDETKNLLKENLSFLERMVSALLEKRTLRKRDIKEIREKYDRKRLKASDTM